MSNIITSNQPWTKWKQRRIKIISPKNKTLKKRTEQKRKMASALLKWQQTSPSPYLHKTRSRRCLGHSSFCSKLRESRCSFGDHDFTIPYGIISLFKPIVESWDWYYYRVVHRRFHGMPSVSQLGKIGTDCSPLLLIASTSTWYYSISTD